MMSILVNQQKMGQRAADACLMDDFCFSAALDGQNECCREILAPILERDDLKIEEICTQPTLSNFYGRSSRLDGLAEDASGGLEAIEMYKTSRVVPSDELYFLKRGAVYAASIIKQVMERGSRFVTLPPIHMIFILDADLFGNGLPLMKYSVYNETEDRSTELQMFIYIVNGTYRGDDPKGRLMADLCERDPAKMHNPALRARLMKLKGTEEGEKKMSEVYEFVQHLEKYDVEAAERRADAAEEHADAAEKRASKAEEKVKELEDKIALLEQRLVAGGL